jgi:hypothetical protein
MTHAVMPWQQEHNGMCASCDYFVYPEYYLGNFNGLSYRLAGRRSVDFGIAKGIHCRVLPQCTFFMHSMENALSTGYNDSVGQWLKICARLTKCALNRQRLIGFWAKELRTRTHAM